jgi:hypothetical protein
MRSSNRSLAFAAALLVAFLSSCMLFAKPPADLDYSRTRVSESGAYRATIKPQGDSIPQGRLQSWTLRIETASGAPVNAASVGVDGGMPQHGHGLPTKPRARRVGEGEYLVEGLKFNMGGWWVVKFRVAPATGGAAGGVAGSDSIVFNLKV